MKMSVLSGIKMGFTSNGSSSKSAGWNSGRHCYSRSFTDNFNLWQWENHLAPTRQEVCLATQDVLTKVPRQHKKVSGLQSVGVGLRDDGNKGPGGEAADFVGIDLGNGGKQIRLDATELQDDIAFCRGAVSQYSRSAGTQVGQEFEQLATVFEGACFKRPVRFQSVEAGFGFGVEDCRNLRAVFAVRGAVFGNGYGETSAIHIVLFDV